MNNPEKRFKILAPIFLLLLIGGVLLTSQTIHFLNTVLIIGIVILSWAVFEHEDLLSSNKLYLTFFAYSLLLATIGFILKNLPLTEKELWVVIIASRMLLYFLIVLKILSSIFLKVLKKNPILVDDVNGKGFWNYVYSFILLLALILSPVIIGELYKTFNF